MNGGDNQERQQRKPPGRREMDKNPPDCCVVARQNAEDLAKIKKAFLTSPDGSLDIEGHHNYHKARYNRWVWWRTIIRNALEKILSGAVVAACFFILQAVWERVVSLLPLSK